MKIGDEIITFIASNSDPDYRFIGLPLCVNYVDGAEWELNKDFSYRTKVGELATVRKGFVFDFASVPRALWWLIPPTGQEGNPYGIAALIHDWLYAHRKIGGRPIVRKEADDLFLEVMLYLNVRKTLAYTMYFAVHSFGWMPWMRRKKKDIIP